MPILFSIIISIFGDRKITVFFVNLAHNRAKSIFKKILKKGFTNEKVCDMLSITIIITRK